MNLQELKSAIVKLPSKELARFRSWFLKETVRRELLEDQADLQAFEARRNEPTISYEKLQKELKARH